MAQIRHIAIASDHPGKTAEFYKKAFGFREVHRHGLDPNNPDVVYIGTPANGLYRTLNGTSGASATFMQITSVTPAKTTIACARRRVR